MQYLLWLFLQIHRAFCSLSYTKINKWIQTSHVFLEATSILYYVFAFWLLWVERCFLESCCHFQNSGDKHKWCLKGHELHFFLHVCLLNITATVSFFFFSLPHLCSPLSSLPSVWTLLWPQRAVPLWLSLPAPLRQQDLYVLLPPQQHRLQVLLQRDRVPAGHAGQPHHHIWWLCTQVSNNPFTLWMSSDKNVLVFFSFCLFLRNYIKKDPRVCSVTQAQSFNSAQLNKVHVRCWEQWYIVEKWAAQDTYGQRMSIRSFINAYIFNSLFLTLVLGACVLSLSVLLHLAISIVYQMVNRE